MTRSIRRTVCATASLFLVGACGVASGHEVTPSASGSVPGTTATAGAATAGTESHHDHGSAPLTVSGSATTAPPAASARPGTITIVRGTPVENLVKDAAPAERSEFCDQSSLPAGEGRADKGGTCVSTPLGEIAKHPVRVATQPDKLIVRKGSALKVRVVVADNQGVLDLNAFTFDATGGAGVTLHEHPAQLNSQGRPLLHCHMGITTVRALGALPGEDYDAAFLGLQGFKGDLTAKITGLPRGAYRGDVYCSGPGHPMLATAKATQVQAFDTFDFVVTGRR